MNKLSPIAIITAIILTTGLSACGGSGSSGASTTTSSGDTSTSGDSTGGSGATNAIDITTTIFTSREADCASYVEQYEAFATDITVGTNFIANVKLTANDDTCTMTSNAIPNHNFNDNTAHFANQVAEQAQVYQIKRNPQMASTSTPLSQQVNNGIMLNGIIIDLLSAGCYDPTSPQASDGAQGDDEGITPIGCQTSHPWLADPQGVFHRFGADAHNAHTQPGGLYHYHGNPNALFDDNPGDQGSPVIGFAADGFPIYGSYFLDSNTGLIRQAQSGYSLKPARQDVLGYATPPGLPDGKFINDWEFTNAGDLDECNGMTIDGQYGYYVIDQFPWVLNCYSGTPHESFNKSF